MFRESLVGPLAVAIGLASQAPVTDSGSTLRIRTPGTLPCEPRPDDPHPVAQAWRDGRARRPDGETELHHPGATCTRARLERLLHPDFHEVGRSGTRYTRQALIDFLADRPPPPRVVACDHRIERPSDGLALLHFASHEVATDSRPRHFAFRMSVWRRTAVVRARWQLQPVGARYRSRHEAWRHHPRGM